MTAPASIHRLRASSAAVDGGRVPVKSAEVRVDEAWTPYVYARLVCPATPALVAALDATIAPRVVLNLEQAHMAAGPVSLTSAEWAGGTVADISAEWAGGTVATTTSDWATPVDRVSRPTTRRSVDLHVRHVRRAILTGELEVELASDEGLLRDLANVEPAPWYPGSGSVRGIVNAVLAMIGAQLEAGPTDGTVAIDATEWEPGVSAWEYLSPLVQAAGFRLWCDEARRWHLTTPHRDLDDRLLALSGAGTITDADDTTSRDRGEWYDAVVIRYEWRDSLGETQVAYDTATADNWSRVYTKRVSRPYPGPGAAATILMQLTARRRMLGLEAVSDYTAEPGARLQANLAGLPEQNGRVSAVEWRFDAAGGRAHGLMKVRSRDLVETPPASWLAAPDTLTWATAPAEMTWATYTPPTNETEGT